MTAFLINWFIATLVLIAVIAFGGPFWAGMGFSLVTIIVLSVCDNG